MRLVIVSSEGLVGNGGKFYENLDLSDCGIPSNVRALQWEEYEPNKGHIEFKSALVQNQDITELPIWADACIVKWQEAYDAEQAAILEAQQTGQ